MSYLMQYALDCMNYEAPETYDLVTKETASKEIDVSEISAADFVSRLRNGNSGFKSDSHDATGWDFQLVSHNRRRVDQVSSQLQKRLPFPFTKDDYGIIANALQLPTIWPHHFFTRQAVPLVVQERQSMINIVLQTPAYPDCFASMALSFDKVTRTTKGYLHLMVANEEQDVLYRTLQGMANLSAHPLLLPSILYRVLDRHCRDIMIEIDDEMKRILNSLSKAEDKGSLKKLLDQIVKQHERLTRSLFTVVSNIGTSCLDELSRMEGKYDIPEDAAFELKEFVHVTTLGTKSRLLERDRLLARIEVQLQVLYNLIAQATADRALQDTNTSIRIASYGQAISVVALIFLPMTAVAGFFSMGPFFSTEGNTLQVSADIWIYFAVTTPITIFIIVAWVLYTKQGFLLELFSMTFKTWCVKLNSARLKDEERGEVEVLKNE